MYKFKIGDKVQCLVSKYRYIKYKQILYVTNIAPGSSTRGVESLRFEEGTPGHWYNAKDFKKIGSVRNLPSWF